MSRDIPAPMTKTVLKRLTPKTDKRSRTVRITEQGRAYLAKLEGK